MCICGKLMASRPPGLWMRRARPISVRPLSGPGGALGDDLEFEIRQEALRVVDLGERIEGEKVMEFDRGVDEVKGGGVCQSSKVLGALRVVHARGRSSQS